MQKFFLATLTLSSPIWASHPFTPSTTTQSQPNLNITPNGRFDTKKGIHTFVAAEAVLFELAQDDLPYALLSNYSSDTVVSGQTYNQHMYHYKQSWHWGMRLTAGYNLPHDGWDIVGVYTRFYSHWDHALADPEPGYLLLSPSQGLPPSSTSISDSTIRFNWTVKFNEWDLEQGRSFYVSKFLRLRPLIGLRNLILGQTFTTHTQTLDTGAQLENRAQVHFWGMGVLAGLNTYWNLNSNFSIYANAKLATLFGYFNPYIHDELSHPGVIINTSSGHQKTAKTGLDLALGIRWDKNINDYIHLGFDVGFEEHTYYNLNKNVYGYLIGNELEGVSGRDFCVQGFTFGMRLDF